MSGSRHEELAEVFGANSWFVELLAEQYQENPDSIPEQWKAFFSGSEPQPVTKKNLETAAGLQPVKKNIPVQLNEGDELKPIIGGPARILQNMENSLAIPTASSHRIIPVKALEENRLIINNVITPRENKKISFTHIIAWALIAALKKIMAMNNAYTLVDGKPQLIHRKTINLGVAVDLERKDGTRSLLVPNIKHVEQMNFLEFYNRYEDLVKRSRNNSIDPSEFLGATITLTNPGTLGTVSSIPRLMQGQGAIIATGAIQYPAEYQAMSPSAISKLGISKVLSITSTYDHRIIQGAESGNFLKEMHELLLGKNDFYEQIFAHLHIPFKPIIWQNDNATDKANDIAAIHEVEKQARVLQLINMYRVRGHLIASLDPLGSKTIYHPELEPSFHNLTIWDYDRTFITGGFGGLRTATLRQILQKLQRTYCEKIGVEYRHIQNHEEKEWLQDIMEPVENRPSFSAGVKKRILLKLIEAEELEKFIHTRFVGHKRFSLEGSETVIPVIDFLLTEAAEVNIEEVVLGMAHRGRINVLANIIGKSYDSIFSEFEDIIDPDSYAGSGDVKYHLGASGTVTTLHNKTIGVSISPNPSHLEWVNPVVEGMVRAKQTRKRDKEHRHTMALLIHGDAAFAGQGIVAESLNLSQLKGYRTGGTIHIIINNQIGFTTTPEDARSTEYATDVAKMVQAPIFHVNGDDPEASLWVMKLALDYRQRFQKDVVIDLFGYRRHGHNEGDEPGFTQPILYRKIKEQPSVLSLYSDSLLKSKIITDGEFAEMKQNITAGFEAALERVKKKNVDFDGEFPLAIPRETIRPGDANTRTAIDEALLNELIEKATIVPENFHVHAKLQKFLEKRRELLLPDGSADWAFAETLAFASLLVEGTPVRLSGQDSVRGTFSQRHLALTDIDSGEEYVPINFIRNNQAKVEALDSFLSEAAVLGFEFGYSTADPLSLVLWEAQFGDFANGAQVIIDNFIVASYEKWQTPNNLVILLPHGFEGQGPEHSSARLERFLTLCAQENMEVCNVSTPAQYFHLLRRHAKQAIQRPLVLMTPKSLLRLPEAKSGRDAFLHDYFREIIDDPHVGSPEAVNRIILTSGKIYYELEKYRAAQKIENVAIVRIEQFYPFEKILLGNILKRYTGAEKLVWVQEEPRNMGAWSFLHERILELKTERQSLHYVGRPASASPAVGSSKLAAHQQASIVRDSFSI
jgi:2-oxoglutarate dehydrogenase E1 component